MKLGITMLIHNKDEIDFVTEFPCFLGHPLDKEMRMKEFRFIIVKDKTVTKLC